MNDENLNIALEIINKKISVLLDQYSSINGELKTDKKIKEKIDLLQKLKDEVYCGNQNFINSIIEKEKKGIF